MWLLQSKETGVKRVSEDQVERTVQAIYRASQNKSLIQVISCKSGSVACMGEAAEQNVAGVWREFSEGHQKWLSVISQKVLKGYFGAFFFF